MKQDEPRSMTFTSHLHPSHPVSQASTTYNNHASTADTASSLQKHLKYHAGRTGAPHSLTEPVENRRHGCLAEMIVSELVL